MPPRSGGNLTASTRAGVVKKAKDARKRLDEGKPVRDSKATVGAFTSQWLSSTLAGSDRKQTTKDAYSALARKHIIGGDLGEVPLDRIKVTTIDAWLAGLKKAELAESTRRQAFIVLRLVLDAALRDKIIGSNPASLVDRPKVSKREAAYLSAGEVERLLVAASAKRYRPLFALLANTGLRRGEALALRWSTVDFTNRSISVKGTLARVDGRLVVTSTKTERVRHLHMTETTATLLREVKARQARERLAAGSQWVDSGYVFTTELGEASDPRNALRAFKVAADRAGIEGVGLHTLRHSAASVMIANRVPLKVVSEILGHSSVAITGDIYAHVAPEVSRDAMEALSGALG
ncbi:site-specific integrase [Nostocoides australiense]